MPAPLSLIFQMIFVGSISEEELKDELDELEELEELLEEEDELEDVPVSYTHLH